MISKHLSPSVRLVLGLALGWVLLGGCESKFQPPFLNDQDCVQKTTRQKVAKGDPRIQAPLDARDFCREQFDR